MIHLNINNTIEIPLQFNKYHRDNDMQPCDDVFPFHSIALTSCLSWRSKTCYIKFRTGIQLDVIYRSLNRKFDDRRPFLRQS